MRRKKSLGISGRKKRENNLLAAVIVVLVLLANLVVFAVADKLALYAQITDKQYYTVTGAADEFLSAVNPDLDPVTFYFCTTEAALTENTTYGRIYDLVCQYAERYDFFTVEHLDIYYDDDIVSAFSDAHEDAAVTSSSVILSCDATGQSIIRSLSSFYIYDQEDTENDDMIFNGEEVLAALIARTWQTEHQKACFTVGHGETAPMSLNNLLYAAGFDLQTLDLAKDDLPSDCGILIVSAPLYDFEEYEDPTLTSEISRMRDYIAQGGTVWVLRSPRQTNLPRLDAFCASYGMTVTGGTHLKDTASSVSLDGLALLLDASQGKIGERIQALSSERILFGRTAPITLVAKEGVSHLPLLQTSSNAVWIKEENTEQTADGFAVAALCEVAGEDGKTGRLLLCGSADVANADAMDTEGYGNEAFLYAALEYCTGANTPAGCGTVQLNMYPLENITRGDMYLIFALMALIPAVCVSACGIWICRRRALK